MAGGFKYPYVTYDNFKIKRGMGEGMRSDGRDVKVRLPI